MSIFDNVAGMLGGAEGQQSGGGLGMLGSLLQGGGEGQSANIVGALLGGGGQGGMQGTLETLAANGLADHVNSWLSSNPNLPVSADQIRDALGSEQVQSMANASGLPVGDFLQHLAQHLPQAAAAAAAPADGSAG